MADNKPKPGEGNEADSQKPNPEPNAFDPKNLSDEDLDKVFDDPRIWNHKRFKELNEAAQKGKKAAEKLEDIENENLKKKGEFEKLAEREKQRAEEALKALQTERINNALQAEAIKQGAVDLESVLKLVDQSTITVSDEGAISGTEEAVKGLLENKPFLKSNPSTPNIGSGTQPAPENTGVKKFTLSQIQDPAFYQEHHDDIMAAQRAGQIIDDQAQPVGPRGPQG